MGKGFASELLFTGKRVSAEEALSMGLVNAVHEPAELDASALKLARSIARNSPAAITSTKRLIAASEKMSVDEGLHMEMKTFADAFESHDQREGMGAFLRKRKPDFEDLKG